MSFISFHAIIYTVKDFDPFQDRSESGAPMKRYAKLIDVILTVFLLGMVLLFGIMTVKNGWKDLYRSVAWKSRFGDFLPEKPDPLDQISARIRSLESAINENIWKKDEMGWLSSTLQYKIGKEMINTGTSAMITLEDRYLYDLPEDTDTSAATDEVARFKDSLEVPFLYVHCHPTTYGNIAAKDGYAMLDPGYELSDRICSQLKEQGVPLLDSRDLLKGEDPADLIMRTDQHWTTYAALATAKAVAEKLGLDASLLDPDRFETDVLPEKFMGKYGQKIGPGNITPDDITLWWPSYETELIRHTENNRKVTEVTGPFRDSMIAWDFLEGEGWNIEAYKAYGLTEDFEHFHNENGADQTLLIFKDSFGSPVAHFLALCARDVYVVDLRKTKEFAPDFVARYDPDQVLVVYSRQMICEHGYTMMPEDL